MSRLVNLWKIVLNEILSIWYEKRCSLCWKTGSLRIYMKEAEKCLLRPVFNWISFPQWLLTRSRKKKEEKVIFSLISSPLTSHTFKKTRRPFFIFSLLTLPRKRKPHFHFQSDIFATLAFHTFKKKENIFKRKGKTFWKKDTCKR